jgi:hypothetical protein
VSPILGIWASANQSQYISTTAYESIATTTLGSSASNITFSSIPSTYTHLQLRGIVRSDRSAVALDSLNIQLNGITSGSYTDHWLQGDGSSASSGAEGANVTTMTFYRTPGAGAGSNMFGAFVIDILDYANTNKNKTLRGLIGTDLNGSGIVSLGSGLYNSTSAVSSIKLYPGASSNWVANTQIALYGIKGA